VGTGSRLRRIREVQHFRVDLVVHRLLVVLDFLVVQLDPVDLVLLVVLDFRLVLGGLLDRVRHLVPLVLGMKLSEYHLDLELLAVLGFLVVRLVQHLRQVQQVLVDLDRLPDQVIRVVHQVLVVLVVRRFLEVLEVRLGKIDMKYLVADTVLRPRLELRRFRVVQILLGNLVGLLVLVALEVQVDSLELMVCIDNGQAKRLQLDVFDGRCC